MRRSDERLRILIVFASVVLGGVGCGGVTSQSDAGQTAGKGGSGTAGAAGQTGAAGDQRTGGSGGSAGSGCGGVGGCGQAGNGGAGGSGASGSGGTAGMGGVGGSGQGGHAGGIAGAAGNTDGGANDAIDAPMNACGFLPTIDRSCTVDADCLAFTHTTNCCGSAIWVGIRASEKDRFTALEAACDRTYPACGCASGPPLTDDGSIVRYGSPAGVRLPGWRVQDVLEGVRPSLRGWSDLHDVHGAGRGRRELLLASVYRRHDVHRAEAGALSTRERRVREPQHSVRCLLTCDSKAPGLERFRNESAKDFGGSWLASARSSHSGCLRIRSRQRL